MSRAGAQGPAGKAGAERPSPAPAAAASPSTVAPVHPADDEARQIAQRLMREARHAALGVIAPETGRPFVTRIALALMETGGLTSLVSRLSRHSHAMAADPRVSLLAGSPGPRGDPLTHPRLTVQADARFIDRNSPDHAALREAWLARRPKARLYVDFTDFSFVRFVPVEGFLNAGFGRAYRLLPDDLGPAAPQNSATTS